MPPDASSLPPFPRPPEPPKPLPADRRRRALVLVASLAAGGVVGALAVNLMRWLGGLTPRDGAVGLGVLLAALPLSLFAAVAVHEAGHLLGARLAGWTPHRLYVGPLRLDFGPRGLRARWNRDAGTWGGLAMALPSPGASDPRAFAALVAGGPLASVALAALAAAAAPWAGPYAGGALTVLALLSAVIALATLVPTRAGGFRSDGSQLLGLWRGEPDLVHRMTLAGVMGHSQAGLRPRDWPRAPLQAALARATDPALRAVAALMLHQADRDSGDATAADTSARTLAAELRAGGLAAFPAPFRDGLVLPLVIHLAGVGGDLAGARAWRTAAGRAASDPTQQAEADAALAAAEGRHGVARERAHWALARLHELGDAGMAVARAEALRRYLGDGSG